MSNNIFGTNLGFEDFDLLLQKDELIEEPIPVTKFVRDKRYLGNEFGLSDIQEEMVRHITQVLKPATLEKLSGTEFLKGMTGQEYYDRYTVNEVVAQIGKGGGKDFCSRVSVAYVAYLMHCLRDPLDYYGKGHGVYIDLINLAVNAKQAQQVFFDPLKNLLLASPWAQEVGFEPRVSEIFWFQRPVRMFSGHSEAEGWEGYDVMIVVLDEIAAFKTDVELKGELRNKGSATQIYEMARASITSRFPDVGKVVLLSFPRFRGDFIQQRYNSVISDLKDQGAVILEEKYGNKGASRELQTWAVKAATWEVNPTRHKEEFDNEFRRDPVMARARFQCEPPEMEDAYFRDAESVRAAFNKKNNPITEDGTYEPWFNGTDGHQRFIHVDLGLKRDRAALCMVHSPGLKEIKTGSNIIEKLPIVEMDYIEFWEAPSQQEEIPLSDIRNTIVQLTRRFPVALVTFDHWQSYDVIQSLRGMGINAEARNVKKADYDTLSTCIYDGRFRGYWNELLVEDELLKLKLFNNTKIDHPTRGSKDLADTVAGSTYACLDNFLVDVEVDIEVLSWNEDDAIDYENSDGAQKIYLDSNKAKVDQKPEIPLELNEWLMMI